ncbi:class I SAM-dependent methyltransferase [Candidatus Dependentiae bacterium]|nr:class I SAM-dependent methyltransferase [Candidatus Dependentiae bacterium]
MDSMPISYGKLHSLFYDATKTYAPEREVNFYRSFIDNNPGRVLEAMSGSGRLQIPLLQYGYTVDGVDNSKIMLDRCRQRCAQLGLNPELYEQSLEQLSLPYKYSTVTIAVGSFQLIADRNAALNALKNLRTHMHDKSNLLIDIFVPDLKADPRSMRIARIDNNSSIRLTTRHIFNEQEKIADAFCLYELIIDGKVAEQENEFIQIRWYSDDEFEQLLNEAGFKVVKIYEETFRTSGPSRIVQAQPIF